MGDCMKHRSHVILTFALVVVAAVSAPLGAQGWDRKPAIPPGHRPPAGMCRIWIDGVPPGQQPAPTDCATAVRNRPSNGRVIFGSDARVDRRGKRDDERDDDTERGRRSRGSDDDTDRNRRSSSPDTCVDANRDGRCDLVYRRVDGQRSLPQMVGAVLFERGRTSSDVTRWLGGSATAGSYVDADRDGVPERATWRDAAGQIVQIWTDTNRDGRADRVDVYEKGRIVRSVRP